MGRLLTLLVGAVTVCAGADAAFAQPVTLRPVMLSGTDGPLDPGLGAGVVFGGGPLGLPDINAGGHVGFRAVLPNNVFGMWVSDGSGPAAHVLSHTDGPLGPGLGPGYSLYTLDTSGRPDRLTDSGAVAIVGAGTTANGGSPFGGYWTFAPGARTLLARTGTDGPLGPGWGKGLTFASVNRPNLNEAGDISFMAGVSGPGVTPQNAGGLWITHNGVLRPVSRAGVDGPLGPALGAGVIFSGVDWHDHNDVGRITLEAHLAGPGIDATNDHGVWVGGPQDLHLAARTGTGGALGPGLGPGYTFGFVDRPNLNNAGGTAFWGSLRGSDITSANDSGIWMTSLIGNRAVAREGTDGPLGPQLGAGVHFVTFPRFVTFDDAARVTFNATLGGAGVGTGQDSGIFLVRPQGDVVPIAREGNDGPLGPGLGDGIAFAEFSGQPSTNGRGDIAFFARLNGPGITPANDWGIWCWMDGALVPVVRDGDLVDIDPGPAVDLRALTDVGRGASPEDRLWVNFNDDRTFVFTNLFGDGSQGIFTAHVPEPSAAVLAALLGLPARRRRRAARWRDATAHGELRPCPFPISRATS